MDKTTNLDEYKKRVARNEAVSQFLFWSLRILVVLVVAVPIYIWYKTSSGWWTLTSLITTLMAWFVCGFLINRREDRAVIKLKELKVVAVREMPPPKPSSDPEEPLDAA
ncbi:MAG: hypothetical protein WC526_04790 [Patescibacteria group bacterium]